MELWVRTQDKKRLIKCENIYIDNVGYISQKYFISADSINITYKLGEYKTEERALEILDELQKIIKPQLLFKEGKIIGSYQDKVIREPAGCEIKELSAYVYEMPEE